MNASPPVRSAIEGIVERLVAHYAPEKIVLFGSHAHGQPDEDSDIDLLVVKNTAEPFLARIDMVRRLAAGTHRRIPFDPIVLTPAELEERLRIGDQFIAEVLEKGETLFAA
jgi:predicted nucleotidyltransferase